MTRVTGVGGVFIKSGDPERLRAWYRDHLGVPVEPWGGCAFAWQGPSSPDGAGMTIWSVFAADSTYFAPSTAQVMINYRVADVRGLLQVLRAEGCDVLDAVEESEFGVFGWVIDPDGNKVELWQPPAGR